MGNLWMIQILFFHRILCQVINLNLNNNNNNLLFKCLSIIYDIYIYIFSVALFSCSFDYELPWLFQNTVYLFVYSTADLFPSSILKMYWIRSPVNQYWWFLLTVLVNCTFVMSQMLCIWLMKDNWTCLLLFLLFLYLKKKKIMFLLLLTRKSVWRRYWLCLLLLLFDEVVIVVCCCCRWLEEHLMWFAPPFLLSFYPFSILSLFLVALYILSSLYLIE